MTRTLIVALLTLGDPNRLTGGYLYHRRMADMAADNDARVVFVSFPDRSFPLAALDAPRVMRRAAAGGAQALVLDSICAAFAGPLLTLRRPGLPLIGMLHQPPGGIDYGPPRSTVQAWLDRLAYRRARLLMAASDALAEDLVAEGVPCRRVCVVPPGRDVSTELAAPPGDLRHGRQAAFLCVGNWMERKGIHSLLEAFSRLPAGAGTLHLVGDTAVEPRYAARLRQRTARPDLAGRVVVHGPRTLAEVAAFYAASDAFVLPSLKEPFGTVYGEAMAAGLPVVGWRAGNLPYLAEDGVEGLIVKPGDLTGLRRAMARLADDEPLRRRMGEAARRRAETRPTWKESAALFFNTIREAIGEKET